MDYTVFDVETANQKRDSICSIGIIRYEEGKVVFAKEILINPEMKFNYFNTKIHGIREADVADAPTFPEIWDEIRQYFDRTILVAHNAKSMDLCALYRTLERYQLPLVENDYICTMELAKQIFKEDDSVQSYRLDVLAELYQIDLLHHHDALDDTKACFRILRKFEELYPDFVKAQHYNFSGKGNKCDCSASDSENEKNGMKKLNCIVAFDQSKSNILFCRRMKDPYKGLYNFPGGKVEAGEDSLAAAYRELKEETGIGREKMKLYHFMDLTYYAQNFILELYVGQLGEPVELVEEVNPLVWLPLTEDFADAAKYAGEQNIAHIVNIALKYPIS